HEHGANALQEHPARGDQGLERLAGITVERHVGQDDFGLFEAVGQRCVDELGARLEMPIEGHPTDARLGGDVGDGGIGVLPERVRSRSEDLRPVALGVSPLVSRLSSPHRLLLTSAGRALAVRHAPPLTRTGIYELVSPLEVVHRYLTSAEGLPARDNPVENERTNAAMRTTTQDKEVRHV